MTQTILNKVKIVNILSILFKWRIKYNLKKKVEEIEKK